MPIPIHNSCEALTVRAVQAGVCFLCLIYTYFRVPEPSGRTFAELDMLFEKGVSARKFATTQVNVFDRAVDGGLARMYRNQAALAQLESGAKIH